MGAGLKIDRHFSFASWGSAWRLLIGVLPLTILAGAACGVFLLGLPVGEALLLGAILSPTDPVLAGGVEMGPPGTGEEGEVRFALTAEAGANDGLAFPFVLLGIGLMEDGGFGIGDLGHWLAVDLVWKVGVAALGGAFFGFVLTRLNGWLPERFRLSRSHDGIVSIGITFLAFGLAELAHTFGLIAVFASAVTIRSVGRDIEYTRQIHDFAEEIQRIAMMILLIFFGAALASGLLTHLRPMDAIYVLLVLFITRPIAALVSFVGSRHPMSLRLATGFLGVRGIASLYYITYAFNHAALADEQHMRSLVALVVLVSILVFGFIADPVMRYLDRVTPPPSADTGNGGA
jgi:NhaP-type Na+/H+ or K+/H+ antiporter